MAAGLGAPVGLAGRPTRWRRWRPAPSRLCCATRSVVLAAVRKAKSEAKTSMRTEVSAATVTGPRAALRPGRRRPPSDLRATGRVGDLVFRADDGPLTATVTL